MARYKRQTTVLRLTTITLLLIAWLSSICTSILAFIDIANSNTAQQDLPIEASESSSSVVNSTISSFFSSSDVVISKLGASIGLISTVLFVIPIFFAICKYFKSERVAHDEISTGTSFPRWVGAIILLYSLLNISVTAAFTHQRQALLNSSNIVIIVLCFTIGFSTLAVSLLILIKPKRTVKLPAPTRRYITYEMQDGYYSPRSEYSHYSINDKNDQGSMITTPPRIESSMIRSHSVQRKRVDYFHYLFDEEMTPYASESGHQSPSPSGQYNKRASSMFTMTPSAIDECSRSLNEVSLPSLEFNNSVTPAPKAKSMIRVKRARIHGHEAGDIAMLPHDSKFNSRVLL